MTDLRELLDRAAAGPVPPLDLGALKHRVRRIRRRRRTIAGCCALAAMILVVAVLPHLPRTHVTPAVPPRSIPSAVGFLHPGTTYANATLQTPITFTVPAEAATWRVAVQTHTSLILVEENHRLTISLQRWSGVYAPGANATQTSSIRPVPRDLVGWLRNRPDVREVTSPESVTFASGPAHRVRLAIRAGHRAATGPPVGCAIPNQCVVLGATDDGPVTIYEGATYSFTVLDRPTVPSSSRSTPQATASPPRRASPRNW